MSKKKRRGTAREWVGYDFWREYLGKAGDDVRYGHGAGGGAAGSHPPGRGRRAAACCGGRDGHDREHGARAVYPAVDPEDFPAAAENLLAGAENIRFGETGAFKRADDLALAMESRCYHGGEGRTKMKVLVADKNDYIMLVITAAVVAVLIVFF